MISDTLWSGAGPSGASVPQPKDVTIGKIYVTSSDSKFHFFVCDWIPMELSSDGCLRPKNDLHKVPPGLTHGKTLKIAFKDEPHYQFLPLLGFSVISFLFKVG